MTTYLLDVNVLIALCDPLHAHHDRAHGWFARVGQADWATCPLTENAFIRIASHPSYPNHPGDARAMLATIRYFCSVPSHRFWAADISLLEALSGNTLISHSQVTDIYLLALAVHNNGKLATLDQRMPVDAIPEGRQALELVPLV